MAQAGQTANVSDFQKAFAGLTPEQQKSFSASTPTTSIGGTNLSFSNGAYSPITSVPSTPTQPITSQNLGQTSPLSVPNITPTTSAIAGSGINASVGAKTENGKLAQEQDEKAAQAQIAYNESRNVENRLIEKYLGKGQAQIAGEANAGIPEKSKLLNEINNEALTVKQSYEREIESLEKTFQGSPEGLTQASNALRRTANRELADIGIRQAVATNDLTTAQNLVNRKIDLEFGDLKDLISYQRQFVEDNKEILNKAETNALNLKIRENDRLLSEGSEKIKSLEDTKLKLLSSASQQNASNQILQGIQSATTEAEAITAAGQYGGDMLDREYKKAQLSDLYSQIAERDEKDTVVVDQAGKLVLKPQEATKLNKEITSNDAYKVIRKGQDSLQFLTDFESLFNETGATSRIWSPIENKKIQTKYNATILNLKEFFNLGVLNGPDEAILKSILPDPSNRSAFNPVANVATRSGIDNMKKNIETTLDDRFKSVAAQYGDYSAESLNSLKDLQRVYISQKARLNPSIAKLVVENPNMSYEDIISVFTN